MNVAWLYVAGVYAAAIFLARRCGAAIGWRVALLFYALTLAFFFRPLTGPFVNVPVDVLRGLPPWQYVSGDRRMVNPEQNDLPLQIVPWAHQVRESWKSMRPPIWNSAAGAGYPLLANGQSSALSPLRILALPLPLGQAMAAEGAMKVLVGLTFLFLYCRRRGRSELAGAIGAVMFGLSGFLVSWLHFPLATAACFFPAIMYALENLADRPSYWRITAAAAIWTAALFAGHPETAAHMFLFAVAYLAWMLFIERRVAEWWTVLLACGAAMGLAALFAAPFLAPFLEALPRGRRLLDLTAQPFDPDTMPYSDWRSAVLLLQPHFFGRVPLERSWGPAETEALGGYVGVLGLVGWVAMASVVVRRRAWRSHEAFLAIATLVVFGVLQGWPLLADAIHYLLPVAAHARLRLVLVFLLAAQAAAAVDLLPRRFLLSGAAATAAVLAGCFAFVEFPEARQLRSTVISVLPSIAVLIMAVLVAVWRRRPAVATAGLLCSVAVELFLFGHRWNAPLRETLMYPPAPLLEALRTAAGGEDPHRMPFRIVGTGAVLFPNMPAVYGYEDVRAHDPMANGRYLQFADATAAYDYRHYFPMWENVTAPVIDYLNVKYVLTYAHTEIAGDERFELLYQGLDGRLYRNRAVLPRFFAVRRVIEETDRNAFRERLVAMGDDWAHTALLDRTLRADERIRGDLFGPNQTGPAEAACTIVKADPTEYQLRVDAPRHTMIVSSIPHWPGWKAERNGEPLPVQRVNSAFVGFVVPPGRSSVRVAYEPWTFRYGVLVSITAALLVVAAGVVRNLSARQSDRDPIVAPRPSGG